MARKTEPTAAPTKAVATYSEKLAALARESAKQEEHVGGGSFISTRGGVLSYNGGAVPENRMNVIVLDSVNENLFYAGARYDPDNPTSPVCFSFSRNDDEAAPHEKSEEPQNDVCSNCPQNQWGTADTGRGKACKNIRRLALITEDMMEDIESATAAFLKVPVTSVKEWAGYVNQLNASFKLPPLAFITEISLVPDASSQFKLKFRLVEQIEDEGVLEALLEKRESVEKDLMHPYTPNSERPAPATQKARGRAPAPAQRPNPKLAGRGR